MKLQIIATGSTKWQRFIRQWGVSFLVGEDALFDTFGDPGVLLKNMRKLLLLFVQQFVLPDKKENSFAG